MKTSINKPIEEYININRKLKRLKKYRSKLKNTIQQNCDHPIFEKEEGNLNFIPYENIVNYKRLQCGKMFSYQGKDLKSLRIPEFENKVYNIPK